MSDAERIVVPGLGRLPFFSHATAVGDLVFVSGLLGTKPGTIELAPGGTGPETTQALRNIEQVLVAARSSLAQIAKVNVYLADMKTYDEMNRAYTACFDGTGQAPPARITVGGARLALGANVEIDCVAWRSSAAPAEARPISRATGFVESGGERVYYEVHGEGDPVVLCHGAGGNHVAWYLQVPDFARTYRVVAWDQRGFGRTTNRADQPTPANAVVDLIALLDHLGIARAHVIGQSMGGCAALGLALAQPARVRSLVLADTIGGIWTDLAQREFEAFVRRAGTLRTDALPLGRHPAIDESLLARDPAHAFLYQQLQSLNDAPPASVPLHLRATAHAPEALARLPMPVLFVVGGRDAIFPPAVIRSAAAQIPGARVVEIPGAGHSPYFEKPREWNEVVLAFLRGARGPRRRRPSPARRTPPRERSPGVRWGSASAGSGGRAASRGVATVPPEGPRSPATPAAHRRRARTRIAHRAGNGSCLTPARSPGTTRSLREVPRTPRPALAVGRTRRGCRPADRSRETRPSRPRRVRDARGTAARWGQTISRSTSAYASASPRAYDPNSRARSAPTRRHACVTTRRMASRVKRGGPLRISTSDMTRC